MHLTCGSLRHFQAFFWLRVFPASQAVSTLAHTQVTQTVRRWSFSRVTWEIMRVKTFLVVILAIALTSCTPISITKSTETPSQVESIESIKSEITQDMAIEIAKKSCGSFRSVQLEEPYESQANLMSYDEGYKKVHEETVDPSTKLLGNPVWFVQIKGKWQGFGFPYGGLTPTPLRTPTLWNVCKVLVDAQSGEAFTSSYRWNTPSP